MQVIIAVNELGEITGEIIIACISVDLFYFPIQKVYPIYYQIVMKNSKGKV